MFESNIYNDGSLIVGEMSGVIEPQSFINGIFWQIDSRNVGEVKEGFCQLYYDHNVESVMVSDTDIKKIAEINGGLGITVGKFRTALVFTHPEIRRLAKLHQSLAKEQGFEVEIFEDLASGFSWLGCNNPEPNLIKM